MRLAVTTPAMLALYDHYNAGKPYGRQIRPFGFGYVYTIDKHAAAKIAGFYDVVSKPKPGKPKKPKEFQPIAPFEKDLALAATRVIDAKSGEPVDPRLLKTHETSLATYHKCAEPKFHNGRPLNRGPTEPRHVRASGVRLKGKEGNRVDDPAAVALGLGNVAEYGAMGKRGRLTFTSAIGQFAPSLSRSATARRCRGCLRLVRRAVPYHRPSSE